MAVIIKGSLYDILMGSVSAGYLMQIVWNESSIPFSTFPFQRIFMKKRKEFERKKFFSFFLVGVYEREKVSGQPNFSLYIPKGMF